MKLKLAICLLLVFTCSTFAIRMSSIQTTKEHCAVCGEIPMEGNYCYEHLHALTRAVKVFSDTEERVVYGEQLFRSTGFEGVFNLQHKIEGYVCGLIFLENGELRTALCEEDFTIDEDLQTITFVDCPPRGFIVIFYSWEEKNGN